MSGISVNYDVDEMWGGVKSAIAKKEGSMRGMKRGVTNAIN